MAIPNEIKTKAAPEVELTDLSALTPDDRNANKGTQRGTGMLESSLRKYGAGRSILLDKHGRIIAGNKTAEGAASIGMDDVVVVESDGTRLVAVKRTDLDLDDPQTRELAIADNRTGEINLDWNADELQALIDEGVDLSEMFTDQELAIGNWEGHPLDADPSALWAGMPEYDHEDKTAFRSLRVNFARREDVESFARLIGQTITDKTRSIWYPEAEIGRARDKRYSG